MKKLITISLFILLLGTNILAMGQKAIISIVQAEENQSIRTLLSQHCTARDVISHIMDYIPDGWVLEKTIQSSDSTPIGHIQFSPSNYMAWGDLYSKSFMLQSMTTGAKAIKLWCESEIISIAFSPDGEFVACGTKSGHVYLWHYTKDGCTLIKKFTELYNKSKNKGISDCAVSFLSNGQYLIGTCTIESGLCITHSWGVKPPHYPHVRLKQQNDEDLKISAYSGDGRYAAYYDKVNNKIDIYHDKIMQSIAAQAKPQTMHFSHDGNYLVIVSFNCSPIKADIEIQIFVKQQQQDKISYVLYDKIIEPSSSCILKATLADNGLNFAWIEKSRNRSLKIYNMLNKKITEVTIDKNLVLQPELRFVKNSHMLLVGFTKQLPDAIQNTPGQQWDDINFVCGFWNFKLNRWMPNLENNDFRLWTERKRSGEIVSRQYYYSDDRENELVNPEDKIVNIFVEQGLPIALSPNGEYLAIGMPEGRISLYKNLHAD